MNKAFLLGNAGKPAELREVGNGKKATFSVAVTERYRRKDGTPVESTEWFAIEAWDKLAEIAERYVLKGSKVLVEGKMKSEKYTDSQGVDRVAFKIVASSISVLDRNQPKDEDDDLPN